MPRQTSENCSIKWKQERQTLCKSSVVDKWNKIKYWINKLVNFIERKKVGFKKLEIVVPFELWVDKTSEKKGERVEGDVEIYI